VQRHQSSGTGHRNRTGANFAAEPLQEVHLLVRRSLGKGCQANNSQTAQPYHMLKISPEGRWSPRHDTSRRQLWRAATKDRLRQRRWGVEKRGSKRERLRRSNGGTQRQLQHREVMSNISSAEHTEVSKGVSAGVAGAAK
jgi:hypothetical protein